MTKILNVTLISTLLLQLQLPRLIGEPQNKVVSPVSADPKLIRAISWNDWDLARLLIEEGANINGATEKQQTVLMVSLMRCGAKPEIRKGALQWIEFLLLKGADPNTADGYGVTPMMIANRVGSPEAEELLRKAGAQAFDAEDSKTKAAFVRIDASLLVSFVEQYVVDNAGEASKLQISFEELSEWFVDGYGSSWPLTWQVISNKGKDIFGNPYILRPRGKDRVLINPKTVEKLALDVKENYWKGFSAID